VESQEYLDRKRRLKMGDWVARSEWNEGEDGRKKNVKGGWGV